MASSQDGKSADAPAPLGWRLRSDVQFEFDQATARYQVRSPQSGERFELGEEEVFLCQRLSQEATLTAVQAAFNARFGLAITESELGQFYQEMAGLGLLEPNPIANEEVDVIDDEAASGPDAVAGKAHDAYQWVWFNPQRGFQWLARHFGWLRHSLWLLVPGVPLALFIILYDQPAYQYALQQLSAPGSHLLFKFVFGLLIDNLLTRISQGVAVSYLGGKVEQFGLRLEFGVIPHFFVGKSIRAITRPRAQRLAAAGGALVVKLTLFVVGMLVWRISYQNGGTLSSYAFILGHLGLGAFLFIANPLWWGDGYVWLSTYLGMPRLRDRAFQILGIYLRGRRPPEGLPPLEKYALTGYIVASIAYILVLIGVVALGKAIYLEKEYQGVGVILFLLLLAMVARWWLSRQVRKQQRLKSRAEARYEGRASRSEERNVLPVAARPSLKSGMPGPSGSSATRIGSKPRRWFWLAMLVLLAVVSWIPYSYDVTGEVTLFPIAHAEVHAVMPGVVERVLARENQWVTPDQVLAELSAWQQDNDILTTQAEIERKQSELDLLLHGPKPEAIEAVRKQLEMAQVRAGHSKKAADLLEPYHAKGVVKDVEYEEALKTADIDKAAVGVAGANLGLIKSPPLALEVTAKQAELKQLREQLNYLKNQRERTQLRALLAGKIVTPRLEFKTGSFLKEGDLFAAVEDNRIMRAEILAPETDIGEVQLNTPVRLRIWAYPLRDFTGRVAAIAPVAEVNPGNPFMRIVRVSIEIPNSEALLRSQMTGFAKITIGDKPFIIAFTRALVRFVMLEMWSWLP